MNSGSIFPKFNFSVIKYESVNNFRYKLNTSTLHPILANLSGMRFKYYKIYGYLTTILTISILTIRQIFAQITRINFIQVKFSHNL